MNKEHLRSEVKKWRALFYNGQRLWSIAHHTALFGAVLCSVVVAALLQSSPGNAGIATVFTSVAAALSGIAASGGFDRKWRSNRLSRSRLDGLLIDLDGDSPDLQALAAQL